MRTVLITLIGPERTTDLVVDADTPVQALMASLLGAGGIVDPGAGEAAWGVALMGRKPLEPDRTLEQAGVLDGAVLVLRRESDTRGSESPRRPPVASAQAHRSGLLNRHSGARA